MCALIFEYGIATVSWYAAFALRRRVSMSAIGSVIVMADWPFPRCGFPGNGTLPRARVPIYSGCPRTCRVVMDIGRVGVPRDVRSVVNTMMSGGHTPHRIPAGAGRTGRPDESACYQLALVTPGSSPRCAISRKQIRHRPNFRKTARGRPHREHRVYARTRNLGFRFALAISVFLAIPTPLVFLERESEPPQQAPPFLVGGRRGDDRDVHAALPVDLVRVDLVEHHLFGETEGVVPVPVELLGRQAAEVTDARKR